MALAADIANKSIRDALSTIATEVDRLAALPAANVDSLVQDLSQVKQQVKSLDEAINGKPSSSGELPPIAPPRPL